ncbi:serine hydrolase domain-containing protein [Nonomuraea sp. NPDC048881]|uniref:serine hydrolase domain-containing protein n=1 Tax=Nonomuraea sp. NPDC048881 TaxID=3155030 RepID=UPI0033DC262A
MTKRNPINHRIHAIVASAVTAATLVTLAAGPTHAASGYDRAALQRDLAAIRDAGTLGVQARVVSPAGGLSAAAGTAVRGRTVPIPLDGHFRMGSNTKTFVAIVILQLEAEGRLSLGDSVERWLPGLVRGNGNDGRAITVRHLLQHTSGLHDSVGDIEMKMRTEQGYRAYRFLRMSPRKLVALSVGRRPLFSPGARWSYSNINYLLAGMIIEKATGNSWRDVVTRRIITPLRLRETTLPGDASRLPKPHPQSYTEDARTGRPFRATVLSLGWAGPAGEAVTTTGDLGRFWRALLGGRLLTPRQLEKMTTTVPVGAPGREFGLGMAKQRLSCGITAWSHPGGTPGFITDNAVTEDGRTSVIVSRTTYPGTPAQGRATARLIDNALCANR